MCIIFIEKAFVMKMIFYSKLMQVLSYVQVKVTGNSFAISYIGRHWLKVIKKVGHVKDVHWRGNRCPYFQNETIQH